MPDKATEDRLAVWFCTRCWRPQFTAESLEQPRAVARFGCPGCVDVDDQELVREGRGDA